MPEMCYDKFVSNLILDVCVAIVAEYSRLEIRTQKVEFTVRDVFDTRHSNRNYCSRIMFFEYKTQ